jgi:hypothetical protein
VVAAATITVEPRAPWTRQAISRMSSRSLRDDKRYDLVGWLP